MGMRQCSDVTHESRLILNARMFKGIQKVLRMKERPLVRRQVTSDNAAAAAILHSGVNGGVK